MKAVDDAATGAALQEVLGDEDRELIMEEEAFAWAIGRDVLSECGFTDWSVYDERERLGLHAHRYRLGLDDLWPEDLASSRATLI